MTAIDVGSRAKLFMSDSEVLPDEASMQFRRNCLKFYQVATRYLLDNLPLNKPLIKHAQVLHYDKRNSSGSMSAISNLDATVTKARYSLLIICSFQNFRIFVNSPKFANPFALVISQDSFVSFLNICINLKKNANILKELIY